MFSDPEKIEIEVKYLVINNDWQDNSIGTSHVKQGYISAKPAVRVRLVDGQAFLTIKSAESGMTRSEYEYEIPFNEAEEMFTTIDMDVIEKIRHLVIVDGQHWEIDVFEGDNEGLIVAELELDKEDGRVNTDISWLGKEVTDDERYYNATLSHAPFNSWEDKQKTPFWDRDLEDIEHNLLGGKKVTDLPLQHSVDGMPID